VKLAAVVAVAVLVLTGCERFEQQGPPPTYHDSKLDVMRAISEPVPAADATPAAPASAPHAGS
jgi:hypothetical protein